MNKKKRDLLRTMSKISAGAGIILALAAAGTSDFRDELQYADEETRDYHEKRIISQKTENTLGGVAMLALAGGCVGLFLTEKQEKKR